MSAVLYALRACPVATLEAVRIYVLEREEAVDMTGHVDKKLLKVAKALEDEANNISPTGGVHPAPFMRKQAEAIRGAVAENIVGDPGDRSHGPRCSCHICRSHRLLAAQVDARPASMREMLAQKCDEAGYHGIALDIRNNIQNVHITSNLAIDAMSAAASRPDLHELIEAAKFARSMVDGFCLTGEEEENIGQVLDNIIALATETRP